MRTVVAVAGRPGSGLLRVAAGIDPELHEGARRLGRESVVVFRRYAPEGKTKKLRRGIISYPRGSAVQVEAHARSAAGFEYVAVSRFGHRKSRIEPTHTVTGHETPKGEKKHKEYPAYYPKTAKAFPIPGVGFRRYIKAFPALFIPGIGFRRSVKAYKPDFDWRDEAMPEVHRLSHSLAAQVGAKIVSRA